MIYTTLNLLTHNRDRHRARYRNMAMYAGCMLDADWSTITITHA